MCFVVKVVRYAANEHVVFVLVFADKLAGTTSTVNMPYELG